ncbi:MAG: divalent-cation tolerance protein CutA [Candidatus Woesearchaeota archaeon]
MILIYIPCGDGKEAKHIGKELVSRKLIACANVFPIESIYMWEGKAVDEGEVALLCKTSEANHEKVAEAVRELHSYDVPAIIRINAEANKQYSEWVDKETS